VEEKGGSVLPPYEELEAVRAQFAIPVARFCAICSIPRSTWYAWRAAHLQGREVRRRPSPVVDEIEELAAAHAYTYGAWGHRKIWAMMRSEGSRASPSSVARALRRRSLQLKPAFRHDRKMMAQVRKETFLDPPQARNRVWQCDFTEIETDGGGTWRICIVIDYATKVVLAAQVSATSTQLDAINAVGAAIRAAEALSGHHLVYDCVDRETGEVRPLSLVTDNGSAFKSTRFANFIAGIEELRHVRTRHHAPETNGVVERFNSTLKYEHLYRHPIPDAATLMDEVAAFIEFYNTRRPHQTLGQVPPLEAYRTMRL
jgi:transposase InsO family protein